MAKDDEVYTITGAQQGTSVEQEPRVGKYLISMGIRTVCVIAAVFVPGWPRWLFIVGAVGLPYIAVVIANAGMERSSRNVIRPEAPQIGLPSEPTTPHV